MSNPVGAQRYGLGGGDAYYDAVKYGGYTGTREQFGRDQAEFAQNATAVAQAKEEVERNTQTVVNIAQTFTEETVPAAIQSVEEKGDTEEDRLEERTTELVQSINTAGAVQVQAVEDEGTEQIRLVSGAGTAQVEAVEQAGSDQVDAVEQAGVDQVQAVTNEGTAQVGAVTGEGDTQVQRVQDKGDEVLESIPEDYTALDQEVDNLKTALSGYATVDISNLTANALYINGNKLAALTPARLIAVPATGIKEFAITCSVSSTKRVGFTDSVANNATVYDVNEYVGTLNTIAKNSGNHAYLVIQLFINSDSEQTISTYLSGMTIGKITAVDSVARDVCKTVPQLNKDIIPENLYQIGGMTLGSIKASDGATQSSTVAQKTGYIDISGCKAITYTRIITTAAAASTGMAFYDENKQFIPNSGIYAFTSGEESGYTLFETIVPDGAKYARFTWSTAYNESDFKVYNADQYNDSWEVQADAIKNVYPLGLHTNPDNVGVLNVIKRCRQMTDIKWTPAVDLPRYMHVTPTPPSANGYDTDDVKHYLGVFKAGTEYTGIPYGWADFITDYGYEHSFVGLDVGFETFVTAIQNKESIISKENSGSVANNRSVQYSSICSSLTCYALGLDKLYQTNNIPTIPGLKLVTPLIVNGEYINPSIIHLGDVLNMQAFHTSIITDIVKDSNGNVIFIEECEATTVGEANPDVEGGQKGGLCRRVGFSVDDFFARYGDYSLYRYTRIKDVTYTPSKYVNVGDELNMYFPANLPCLPYMGEGFKYKENYIPNTKIVITTDNYSYLRVFKDGTEITGSPFTVTEGTRYVETGFSAAGDYEAYLCNMSEGSNTSVTAKCHWSVV